MAHRQYTAQYKAKIVLEVLQGERELGEIASENQLNPNMVRNWKREFMEKSNMVFEDPTKASRQAKKREESQRKEVTRMLKTIGQLTMERSLNLSKHNFKEEVVPYLLRNKAMQFSFQIRHGPLTSLTSKCAAAICI